MRKIVQKNEVSIMKLSARRGLECRILHHLSQSFLGAAQGPQTPAVEGTELAWGPLKALGSSGINGAKSCILGLSWHLISLLKLLFFGTIFLIFSAIVQDKRPFFTTFDYISLLGVADGTATFQFSPATSKSIDVPECCIEYTPSEHDSNSQH